MWAFVGEKSRIRETLNPLTDADGSTNTKIPANKAKFAKKETYCLRGNYITFMSKSDTTSFHYFSPRIQKSKILGHWTLGSWGKKLFKRSEPMKKSVKHFSFAAPILTLYEQMFSNLRSLVFIIIPQGF